jgi:hypothetical protein
MREPAAELVRINDKGEAHPIGMVASQRMRAREGAFRVMPAPPHVILMRFTGEDGRRDEEDGAIVKLAGEITAPAALCDVLSMMVHTRWRGELMVLAEGGARSIFMENGNIVGAITTIDSERIGDVMFRYGALDEGQREAVLLTMNEQAGMRFGEAAVSLGFVREEAVYQFMGKQVEEIVFAALEVDDGTFFFLDGFDPARLASHHVLSTNMILMDAVTRLDEIRYFKNKIPSSDWVPVKTDKSGAPAAELQPVLDAIDGRRSVAEIGRVTGSGEFETTKALFALAQSKHVAIHPPRMEGGPRAMVAAANTALRTIHQRVDSAGKGTAFRDSLAGFAAGGGIHEMLFHEAGPDSRGSLEPGRIHDNLMQVASGDEEALLKESLHGYVSFALFAAGSLLGSEAETHLGHEILEVMRELQPSG